LYCPGRGVAEADTGMAGREFRLLIIDRWGKYWRGDRASGVVVDSNTGWLDVWSWGSSATQH